MSADTAMTSNDVRHWLERSADWLSEQKVDGIASSGPRIVGEGCSWISFASRLGVGRVVRAADGSSIRTARRHLGDRAAIEERSATTTEAHLVEIVLALGERGTAAA